MQKFKAWMKKIFTKVNMKKFYFSFIWLMVLLFVVDIVTKWIIIKHFGASHANYGEEIVLIKNFLSITFYTNNGAAFSLLNDARAFWIIVSIVLSGALIAYYVVKYKHLNTVTKVALSLMIAGAIGNMIDRCFYWNSTVGFNGVVDWIQVYLPTGPFPTFNIADSCLVIGVIILLVVLIVDLIKDTLKEGNKEAALKQQNEETKNENNSDHSTESK